MRTHQFQLRASIGVQGLLAAVLIAASPAWAINKCTGADGKVVFQDAPCAGFGEKVDVKPASGYGNAAATKDAQARLQKLKGDNDMAEAIRTHVPMVGMTRAQLEQAMGLATQVNADNYNGTQREQVIYERADATWYVYTRNGVVESIQHRPGPPLGRHQTPRRAGPCPSAHEIRNAITSASSITISEAEKTERWKAIREMQQCGK